MKKSLLVFIITVISISAFAQYSQLWTKTYGGSSYDLCHSVQLTADSGYILGGASYSYGSGQSDAWAVRINSSGDTLWTSVAGGSTYDECLAITETSDGHIIMGGYTNSFGAGGGDFYLIKLSSNGDTLWTSVYGGVNDDECQSIIEDSDSNYVLAGYTLSQGAGSGDFWVVKTNDNGDTLWTKTYGGSDNENCRSVIETHDGYYLLAGYTNSFGAGGSDYWLVKIDQNGDTLWTQTYGGSQDDMAYSVIETSDLHYLIGGLTYSYGAGSFDYWLVKTDHNGDTVWTKSYGGVASDECHSVTESGDGNYMLGGSTASYGAGNLDYWVIKTNTDGDTLWTKTYGGVQNEECHDIVQGPGNISVFAGYTESFGAGFADFYAVKISDISAVEDFHTSLNDSEIKMSQTGSLMNISCNEPFSGILSVYDVSGRNLLERTVHLKSGSNIIELNLNSGIYFASLYQGDSVTGGQTIMSSCKICIF